jgi:hypothetical protein
VRTRDVEAEKVALDVLKRHSGEDAHLHPLPSEVTAKQDSDAPNLRT